MKNLNRLILLAILCCSSVLVSAQIGADMPTTVPVPSYDASKVVSIYGHYGTVGQFVKAQGTDYTKKTVDGKEILYFENWNWLEIYFGQRTDNGDGRLEYYPENMSFVDASGMTHVHFDIWQPYWGTGEYANLRPYFRTIPWAEAAYEKNAGLIINIAQREDGWMSIDASLLDFDKKIIFNNVGGFTLGNLFSGDKLAIANIYFYNDGSSAGVGHIEQAKPTAAAVTPVLETGNVVSLYSNAYTAANPGMSIKGNATHKEIKIDGNDVIYAANFPGGLVFDCWNQTSPVNATGMEYLHFNVWSSAECKKMAVWVKEGGTWNAAGAIIPDLQAKKWNSVSIPLKVFTEGDLKYNPEEIATGGLWGTAIGLADIASVEFSQGPGVDVYFDNVFFYKGSLSSINNTLSDAQINIFPNPCVDYITINSDNEIRNVILSNLVGQIIKNVNVNKTEGTIHIAGEAPGTYFVTVQFVDGSQLTKKIIKK